MQVQVLLLLFFQIYYRSPWRGGKAIVRNIKARKLASQLDKLPIDEVVDATNSSRRIDYTPTTRNKSNIISIDGRDIELHNLRDRFNKWAEYYEYPTIPKNASSEEAEQIMKSTFDRHNTYYRGVEPPYTEKDIKVVEEALGPNAPEKEVLDYLAKKGRPDGTFVSPGSNAATYGRGKDVAILRRKYNLGENPKTWLNDADFDIGHTPKTEPVYEGVSYPWASNLTVKLFLMNF